MFQVKDVIVYGSQGVCQITGTEEKRINGSKKLYYVLKPVEDKSATIFVPTDNELARKKMRRLLTKEEIHSLIAAMETEDALWIDNENARKERYREILAGADHRELIRMIKAVYAHKKEREAQGKRLHISDERFFKDAENILYSEFQYVLHITDKAALLTYIFQYIEQNGKDPGRV